MKLSKWNKVDKIIKKRCGVNPRLPARLCKSSEPEQVFFYDERHQSDYFNIIECEDRWQLFFGGSFGMIEVRGLKTGSIRTQKG